MIICRITGGLGNQMFQYALMCAVKKNYDSTEVKADIFEYNYLYAHTGYALEKYFDVVITKASMEEINSISDIPVQYRRPDQLRGFRRIIAKINYRLAMRTRSNLKKYNITDYIFNLYNPEVFHLDPHYDWYLKGYWQNMKYYDKICLELKDVFKFKRVLSGDDFALAEKMKSEESVAVHVRRGDYVNSELDICGKAYYASAMREIELRVSNPVYYFFSDDPDYVEANFMNVKNMIIIRHSSSDCDIDMQLMTMCKHGINANSSYSFWGSVLKVHGGTVIVPKYTMFKNNKWYTGPVLSNWILIDNSV